MKLWMLYRSFNQYFKLTCTNNLITYFLDASFCCIDMQFLFSCGKKNTILALRDGARNVNWASTYEKRHTWALKACDLWPGARVCTRSSALLCSYSTWWNPVWQQLTHSKLKCLQMTTLSPHSHTPRLYLGLKNARGRAERCCCNPSLLPTPHAWRQRAFFSYSSPRLRVPLHVKWHLHPKCKWGAMEFGVKSHGPKSPAERAWVTARNLAFPTCLICSDCGRRHTEIWTCLA